MATTRQTVRGPAMRVVAVVAALLTLGPSVSVQAGTVTGTVRYLGRPPAPEALTPVTDHAVCGSGLRGSEALLLSAAGAVRNAVARIVLPPVDGWAAPALYDIDQRHCAFVPRVLIVPAGSTVRISNNDGILHNFHTTSRLNPPVNLAQPKFAKPLRVTLRHPEIVPVKCDLHGRRLMRAWIIVAAHPHYALSDGDGRFQLSNVPPGRHTLEIWHETLGVQLNPVTVGATGEVSVSVMFTGRGA